MRSWANESGISDMPGGRGVGSQATGIRCLPVSHWSSSARLASLNPVLVSMRELAAIYCQLN